MADSLAVPPKIKPSGLGWFSTAMLGFTALGAAGILYFFNPATAGIYPVCGFHQFTGWFCPGCGATRGGYALLHGQWATAFHDNALFMTLLLVLPVRLLWWQFRVRPQNSSAAFLPRSGWWGLAVLTLIFGVVRNFPAFHFLCPV